MGVAVDRTVSTWYHIALLCITVAYCGMYRIGVVCIGDIVTANVWSALVSTKDISASLGDRPKSVRWEGESKMTKNVRLTKNGIGLRI
jgi:hypothetical protein